MSTDRPVVSKRRSAVRFLVLVLVVLAGVGAWYMGRPAVPHRGGFPGPGRSAQMGQPPASISTAGVQSGDITITIKALGTVASTSTVTVLPQISGQLLTVNFKEGQAIKQGDLLATIDPRTFQAALDQANAELSRDQALLHGAQLDLQRYQNLASQNAVSRQTLDTQSALVQQYTATVAADQAQIQTATINLGYTQIRSPIDGRAGLRQVDPGNYVTPSQANGLVTITRLTDISVLFSVPEDRLPQISDRLAQGARLPVRAFDRSGLTKLADGVLETFDSAIDASTGTIKFRARFPNDDTRLFPNQFVNVALDVDTLKDITVAPTAAIQRGAQGTFVYLVGPDSTVAVRPVTLGVTDGDRVQIVSGLSVNDQIVLDGADRLRDGMKINVRSDQPGQPDAATPEKPHAHKFQGRERPAK